MNAIFSGSLRRAAAVLLCAGLLALSGCASGGENGMAPAGSIATTVSGVGHLGRMVGIPEFYVNGQWGGNNGGWGGGGGGVCCVSMPYSAGQTTMVTVKWETLDIGKGEDRQHEATVPVHFDVPPGKGSGIKVHFLPGDRVEVWYTFMGASGSTYPGPKYPRGPAPDYAPLSDETPTPAKVKQ